MLAKRGVIRQLFTPKVKLLGEETGLGQHNARGEGIEHFGYIDGRSQPLFLTDEIAAEPKAKWDPAFALDRVLVADKAAPNPVQHFGSFFVLRKLEQNVRAFHKAEADVATALGLTGERPQARAGAMIVGRFRDGTAARRAQQGARREPDPERLQLRQGRHGRSLSLPRAHPQDEPAWLGRRPGRSPADHGPPRPDVRQAHRRPERDERAAVGAADGWGRAAVHGLQLRAGQPVRVHAAVVGGQPGLPVRRRPGRQCADRPRSGHRPGHAPEPGLAAEMGQARSPRSPRRRRRP